MLATITGTLVGIGRLSRNFLVRSLCTAYVELFRNVPLLLQLFIWYFVFTEFLPPIDEALQPLPDVFFSKNGLQYPIPVWATGHVFMAAGFVVGIVASWYWAKLARRRFEATGRAPPVVLPALGLIVGLAFLGWLLGGGPTALDIPEKTEITVVGGGAVTPEFLTVLIGLTLYTASYIAEIVRGGIQAVAYGQHEAAIGDRPERNAGNAAHPAAAGVARDHSADHEPVPQSHQELVARRRGRLSRPRVDLDDDVEPDRPRDRGDLARDARLSHDVAAHGADHESLQPAFVDSRR